MVISLKDLSSSVWLWYRDNGKWAVRKVIEIAAEPADAEQLPPLLKSFKAVPPLIADINLSLDDRFLYVSCWGTGEIRQYDVSDPHKPRQTGSVRLGGIVKRTPHPASGPLNGGPQMVEVSRDGRRMATAHGAGLMLCPYCWACLRTRVFLAHTPTFTRELHKPRGPRLLRLVFTRWPCYVWPVLLESLSMTGSDWPSCGAAGSTWISFGVLH